MNLLTNVHKITKTLYEKNRVLQPIVVCRPKKPIVDMYDICIQNSYNLIYRTFNNN